MARLGTEPTVTGEYGRGGAGGPGVRWGRGCWDQEDPWAVALHSSGRVLFAGVSAPSFLHCFTLASSAFNLQVVTPGVSPATRPPPSLSGDETRTVLLLLGEV